MLTIAVLLRRSKDRCCVQKECAQDGNQVILAVLLFICSYTHGYIHECCLWNESLNTLHFYHIYSYAIIANEFTKHMHSSKAIYKWTLNKNEAY